MTRIALLIAAALALTACQRQQASPPVAPTLQAPPPAAQPQSTPAPAPAPQASDDWRAYASSADVDRLARLDGAWDAALAKARKGHAAELAALGALADSHARALVHPHPAPGDYRCRAVKLGGALGFISYPWFKCRVELSPGGDLSLRKLNGSQRTEGLFYPKTDTALVYLGGQAWGADEAAASVYGAVPARDQIGVLERIGDQRWRLLLPWPRVDSDLDIVELAK